MSKAKTAYVCRDCGTTASKWQGQCVSCGAWNTLEETVVSTDARKGRLAGYAASAASANSIVTLSKVREESTVRWSTGSREFDRALGGGLVPGGVILVGGDPGIGKSTVTLQALAHAAQTHKTLYVSGEESPAQVASRARRLELDLDAINMLAETQLEAIMAHIHQAQAKVVVIDSIQTLYTEQASSAPGSVVQVRECAAELTRLAKSSGACVIMVGHVTKEGAIAGPRILEHLVDTVVYFEGEPGSNTRIIRALKNRFGAANEIGVFAMMENGLRDVSNPSALFLNKTATQTPGNVVFPVIEGSRPLLVQVQALVDHSAGHPRRVCTGFDGQRLAMLIAVMNKQLGAQLNGFDVFVNIVGGLKINEPAADMAIVLAVWSSLTGRVIPPSTAVFGELGLGGELRPVVGSSLRVAEAVKLGFTQIIAPLVNRKLHAQAEAQGLVSVPDLAAAIEQIRRE